MSACFKITVSPSFAPQSASDFALIMRSRRAMRRCQSEIAFDGELARVTLPLARKSAKNPAADVDR